MDLLILNNPSYLIIFIIYYCFWLYLYFFWFNTFTPWKVLLYFYQFIICYIYL